MLEAFSNQKQLKWFFLSPLTNTQTMRDFKSIRFRLSENDFNRAKALAEQQGLKMSEYFRMMIQVNYSIKLAAEGKKPQKIANEFGFQLNEEFIHGFVKQMSDAMAEFDIADAIKVDTSKPDTILKQTFKKAKKVA